MPAGRVFFSAGGVQMGPHRRAIQKDFFQVGIAADGGKQPFPDAFPIPAREPRVRGVPVAEFRWQIPPGCAGAQYPQDGFNELPVVRSRNASISGFARQQVFDPLPLVVAQNPSGHCANPVNELESYSNINC